MVRKLLPAILGVLVALVAAPALAQEQPQLRVDLRVEKELVETSASGEAIVRRLAVDSASVGDVLVYTLNILNEGNSSAHAARVVDPIPDGTVLIPDSVQGPGAEITYSIDGGESFSPYPITHRVTGSDGRKQDVPVPAEQYTHVRWTLTEPLAPGQVHTANFKVRVQ